MEDKFWKVRKQLDELGYRQILVPDCVPLVEKLLADLIQTTESLQKYMKIAKNAVEERDNLQLGAEPYRCDNAKLVKECNELHLAFLQFREQNEKLQKDLKQKIIQLENERLEGDRETDKLTKQIRSLQFDLAKRNEHILAADSKKSVSSINKPILKTSSSTSALRAKPKKKSKDNFEINSAMALSEQKISNLTKEIKKLKDEQLHLTEINESYKNQLNNRDREIQRLMSMLEGGRPHQALNKDCCYRDVDNKVAKMRDDMNMLHREKGELEGRLKEAVAKQHEAMKRALHLAERNKQLEKEMKDIDQMALAVEAECNSTVKNSAEKVIRLQDRMHDTVIQIQQLERETGELKREKQELLSDLNALRLEKTHLQAVLETALEEKKCMTDRMNQFTIIERDLNKEIDRLVQLSASQKRKIAELECKLLSGKLDAVTDSNIIHSKLTKKGKSKYTSTSPPGSRSPSPNLSPKTSPTRTKTKSTKKKSPVRSSRKKSVSPKRSKSPVEEPKVSKTKLTSRTSSRKSRSRSPPSDYTDSDNNKKSSKKQSKCACCESSNCLKQLKELLDLEMENRKTQAANAAMDNLKAEKDYFMREYHRLQEQLKNIPSKPDNNTELIKRLNEKEEMIKNLQHENKTLSQEKYSLMSRLETARDRPDTDLEALSMRSVVKRLERERDLLRGDFQRLEEERDAIRQRLKNMAEMQAEEHARMEKTVMESEEQVRRLEQDRRDLMHTQGTRRATINNLEEQCDVLKEQLRTNQTELNQQRALYGQLKTLHEQTDRALADSQSQVLQLEQELANAHEKIRNLDQDRGKLDKEISTLRNDLLIMKGNLAQIDQEKDSLLITVDDKTERVAMLEQDLKLKDKEVISLEGTVAELKKKLSMTVDEFSTKDHLLRTTTNEVHSLRQDLEAAIRAKEHALQENRRLQDDLAACTADSRSARNELELSKRHVEDLKIQLQHYVAEIKRTEDLISQKEIERSEMLDQFRTLSHEATMLENNNHSLENEATQSKVQLSVALDHAADLEHRLENQETMVRSYERQIADLTSQVASMEVQIKQYVAQQDRSDTELQSMRDLCVKLDKQKDNLSRELQDRDGSRVQIDRDFERMRRESETLQNTLAKDRSNVDSLERLLAESRQETVEQRLINQELQTEVQQLRNKIEDLQQKVTATCNQLDLYQEKALDYSQQNKQLRRELANERFHKFREDENKPHGNEVSISYSSSHRYESKPSGKRLSFKDQLEECSGGQYAPLADNSRKYIEESEVHFTTPIAYDGGMQHAITSSHSKTLQCDETYEPIFAITSKETHTFTTCTPPKSYTESNSLLKNSFPRLPTVNEKPKYTPIKDSNYRNVLSRPSYSSREHTESPRCSNDITTQKYNLPHLSNAHYQSPHQQSISKNCTCCHDCTCAQNNARCTHKMTSNTDLRPFDSGSKLGPSYAMPIPAYINTPVNVSPETERGQCSITMSFTTHGLPVRSHTASYSFAPSDLVTTKSTVAPRVTSREI